MFHSLKELLTKTLIKHKLASSIEASLICKKTNVIIQEIIGTELAEQTQALYFRDNTITIQSNSAQIISELKLYNEAILEKLTDEFPKKTISSLRFLIK